MSGPTGARTRLTSLLWHMPGRTATAMLRAGPLRVWAIIGAGPGLTLAAVGQTLIIWRGPFPATPVGLKQLDYLGMAHIGVIILIGVIVVALAAVKVRGAGPAGLSLEIDGGDDAPTVTTTVQTEIKQP